MTHAADGAWYYQQIELGYNYRLTDLQAALGSSQLKRIDTFVELRHSIKARYDKAFKDLPLRTPWQHSDTYSSFHLYIIRLDLERSRIGHKEMFDALRAAGILVNLHYIPVHLQPYYTRLGFKKGSFPEAEKYYAEAISLPMYASLTEKDQDRVISTVHRLLEA